MRDGFRIFDTHTHIGEALHSGRCHSVDELLRDMDRCGVDRSLVIPFPVVADQRAAHEEIGRAVKQYPKRLAGAACLHPFMPRGEFMDELKRCREEYGFVALKLQPQYHGLNPLSERSDFFFEAALKYGMVAVIHTGGGIPFSLPAMFMPAARKFPDLKIVLAHCGGGGMLHGEAIVAAQFCPNIYLELSTLMPNHMLEVLKHVSSTRLMIGSDLAENLDVEIAKVLWLKVAEQDKRNMLSATSDELFGIDQRP